MSRFKLFAIGAFLGLAIDAALFKLVTNKRLARLESFHQKSGNVLGSIAHAPVPRGEQLVVAAANGGRVLDRR